MGKLLVETDIPAGAIDAAVKKKLKKLEARVRQLEGINESLRHGLAAEQRKNFRLKEVHDAFSEFARFLRGHDFGEDLL